MNSAVSQPEQKIPTPDARRRRACLRQIVLAGAATIATLALVGTARSGAGETIAASGPAHSVGFGGFAADDPSNPGYSPPSPGYTPPDPGYSPPPVNTQSQPDPGWNADPGWDFQPSP
jgi:hypothetical protein